MKLFYAGQFNGKTYAQIVKDRQNLNKLATSHGLELLEQFIGVEKKEKFEAHEYGPLFIANKDFTLINEADIIIGDFNSPSIGRDYEVAVAKELFDKRCVAVVSDSHNKNHPWIRLYSDYVVPTVEDSLKLSKRLSAFPLAKRMSELTRDQKDQIDKQVFELVSERGIDPVLELLPTELKRRWEALFGDEYRSVMEFSFKKMPKTIRVNTLKSNVGEFRKIAKKYSWDLTSLQISPIAFRLPVDIQMYFGDVKEHEQGLFYVQELASMLPVLALNPKPGDTVLDIAAAPGSKTTFMAQLLSNKGKILANDISKERLEVLKNAVNRLGIKNIEYHPGDGAELGKLYTNEFDKVLVDSPCSTEGILRYKPHKFFEWGLLSIYHMTKIQERLLDSGFNALKPGGKLVYSTCAFSPEENEAIVEKLLSKYPNADIEELKFAGVRTRNGLVKWEHFDFDKRLTKTVRIYPQDNDTIGFFIASISKK